MTLESEINTVVQSEFFNIFQNIQINHWMMGFWFYEPKDNEKDCQYLKPRLKTHSPKLLQENVHWFFFLRNLTL